MNTPDGGQESGIVTRSEMGLAVAQHKTDLAGKTDSELAALAWRRGSGSGATSLDALQVEMSRRLIASIGAFEKSTDTWSRRLLIATWVIVVLTVVLAVLTVVLVARGR